MKRKTSKRKRKAVREEFCTYYLEILEWEMPYFFSLPINKDINPGPYWEHLTLRMTGKVLEPKKLEGRMVEIDILGDREKVRIMETPENYHFEPKAVGGLTARKGEQAEFFGSIPIDILPIIYSMLESGNLKILELRGQPLYYGGADITWIRFEKDFKPEV